MTAVQGESLLHFAREPLEAVWDEAWPLFAENQAETGAIQGIPFEPQKDQYLKLAALGITRLFTARDDDGRLLGYSLFIIAPHLCHPGKIIATNAVTYLHPEHRGFGGAKFLIWVDDELRAEAHYAKRQVTPGCDYSRTLARLDYHKIEETWLKELHG